MGHGLATEQGYEVYDARKAGSLHGTQPCSDQALGTAPLSSAIRLHDERTASVRFGARHNRASQGAAQRSGELVDDKPLRRHVGAPQRLSESVDDKPLRYSWRKAAKHFFQRPRGTLRQKIRSSLRRKMGLSNSGSSTAAASAPSENLESLSNKRQIYFRRLGVGTSSQDAQAAPILTPVSAAVENSDSISSSSEAYRKGSKQLSTQRPAEGSDLIKSEGSDFTKEDSPPEDCAETASVKECETEARLQSQKDRSDFRMSFLSKLSYEKVWVPKPERPRQHSTLIVLDWDDTLLCTSFLLSQNLSSRTVTQRLECVARAAIELLILAKSLGETLIITNAVGSWVEQSAKDYLPSVLPFLADLEVISARQRYEMYFPDQVAKWKAETFVEVQKRRSPESITNFISIGDSSFERDAALRIGDLFPQAVIKIIKFKEDPTPEELAKELRLACDRLRGIVEIGRALQVSMERKACQSLLEFAASQH
eukprot:TRINITY_DN14110_c0_g1_i1.p1 TRINITY_DN14110_c0_g1~~TRINITY_DN14110_c0_g1_i1.p1  ORF type:complete len:482 (+),score=80.43 TRINITY_DN14110_c0_g1_i1:92-1537(+)